MTIKRPASNEKPDSQASKTPSGKKVPMAMSMMVDSMVRMIQNGNIEELEDSSSQDSLHTTNGD